jgi:hypothetical protein
MKFMLIFNYLLGSRERAMDKDEIMVPTYEKWLETREGLRRYWHIKGNLLKVGYLKQIKNAIQYLYCGIQQLLRLSTLLSLDP